MNLVAILREIDADLEKLQRARAIVVALATPISQPKKKTQRQPPVVVSPLVAERKATSLPSVVIVPPRIKREYRRKRKPLHGEPRALSSVVPAKPVFVPRASLAVRAEPVPVVTELSPEAMEAALRLHLLGDAA